jgi:hypothetical protein
VITGPSASVRPGVPAIVLGTGLIHGVGPGGATARVAQGDAGAFALLNADREIGGSIGTTLLSAPVASADPGGVASHDGAGTVTAGESGQK